MAVTDAGTKVPLINIGMGRVLTEIRERTPAIFIFVVFKILHLYYINQLRMIDLRRTIYVCKIQKALRKQYRIIGFLQIFDRNRKLFYYAVHKTFAVDKKSILVVLKPI